MKYPRLPFSLNRNRVYSDGQRELVKSLYKEGYSMMAITKIVGMSYGSVQRYAKPNKAKEWDRNKWLKNKNSPQYQKAMKKRHKDNIKLQRKVYPALREYYRKYMTTYTRPNPH